MDLLTFERKGNCNSTHGMCIDSKVFINSKYLELYYLTKSWDVNVRFVDIGGIALAFALEINMVEYNNHDKILYYRKKDNSN